MKGERVLIGAIFLILFIASFVSGFLQQKETKEVPEEPQKKYNFYYNIDDPSTIYCRSDDTQEFTLVEDGECNE